MNTYPKAMIAIAPIIGIISCSTVLSAKLTSEYHLAMDSLRRSTTTKGIPREKVFYQFQLYGVSSKRHGGGSVRGGWTSAWEEWSLPQEFRLVARKFTYVGRDLKIIPLKKGESVFSSDNRFLFKEEYYQEARLEPYFDSISLIDKRDKIITEINLPRKK